MSKLPKAVLISHKFNPGHLSHLLANKSMLELFDLKVYFRWNNNFNNFSNINVNEISLNELLYFNVGDSAIIWFPSFGALFDAFCLRIFTSATVVYILHEPYTSYKSYRESGFSTIRVLRIMIVSIISYLIRLLSHKIILPSDNAWNSIGGPFKSNNKFCKLNLMFEDECEKYPLKEDRIYISYIGTIAEDHAFDSFVKLMVGVVKMKALRNYSFLIATKSNLPISVLDDVNFCIAEERLVLQSGRPLSNPEINNFFSRSIVVWNAYRRSMQSGVLPKAYMFGTPVIISENNSSEFFINKKTGVMLSSEYSINEFINAIININNNFISYSSNCRCLFMNKFFYKSLSITFLSFVFKGI